MRLYLATNSEVRLQIRNIQNLINIIFSKYLRFLRKEKQYNVLTRDLFSGSAPPFPPN